MFNGMAGCISNTWRFHRAQLQWLRSFSHHITTQCGRSWLTSLVPVQGLGLLAYCGLTLAGVFSIKPVDMGKKKIVGKLWARLTSDVHFLSCSTG